MGLGPRQVSTLSIGAISAQMWLVDQDFSVQVAITGNPDEAYITGDIEGFGTDFDSATGILNIEGHPENLLVENTFTIHANKGTQSITRSVMYSVVTPSPVIESFGPLSISKGTRFEQQINIANNPTDVKVTGPWIFLNHETNAEGVLIFGDIPSDKDFTIDSGTITVVATNSGGEHTLTGTANILDYARFDVRQDDNTRNAEIFGMAVFGGIANIQTGDEYSFINILYENRDGDGQLLRYRSDTLEFHSEVDFTLQSGQNVLGTFNSGGLCAEGSPNFDFYYITTNFGNTIRIVERDWFSPSTRIRAVNIGGRYKPIDITFGNNRVYSIHFDDDADGGDDTYQVRAYTATGSHSSSSSFDPDIPIFHTPSGICYDDVNDRIYIFTYLLSSDPPSQYLFRCYNTSGVRQTQYEFTPESELIQANSSDRVYQHIDYNDGNFYVGDFSFGTVTIFEDPNA